MDIREICTWLAGAPDTDIARVRDFIKTMPAATLVSGGSTYRFWNDAYYLTTSVNETGRTITHITWSESGVPITICGFTVAGPIADGAFEASHTAFGTPITGTVKMNVLFLYRKGAHECVVPCRLIFSAADGRTREVIWGINGVEQVRQNRADGYSLAVFDRLGGLESSVTVAGNVKTERHHPEGYKSMPRTVTTKLNRLLSRVEHWADRTSGVVTIWKLHLASGDVEAICKESNGIYSLRCGKYVYNFRESGTATFEFLGKIEDD